MEKWFKSVMCHTMNLIGTKQLVVKITPLLEGTKKLVVKITPLSEEGKELVVKITPLLDVGNIHTKKILAIQNRRRNRRKSVLPFETDHGIESLTKHLEDDNNEEVNRNKVAEEAENNNNGNNSENVQIPKELFVKITRISNDEKVANEDSKESTMPEKHNVKLNLKMTKTAVSHDLRNLLPKNYAEESLIDMTNGDLKPKIDALQRKDHIPIYRKNEPDEPRTNKNQNDLYEFIDVSPKKKGTRKSSIIFDKITHDILQEIEEKEAKAVKKRGRKKKNVSKPVSKQLYNKKVEMILSNINQKISKKNRAKTNLDIPEKEREEQNLNNKSPIVQNKMITYEQSKKIVPSNVSHTQMIPVNNFNDETSITVHHSAKVPSNKDKSVPQERTNMTIMENITLRKRTTPSNNNVQNNRNLVTGIVSKETNAEQAIYSPILFDSIEGCSDSDDSHTQDGRNKYGQGQENVPLNDGHTKVIQVNDFNDETSIIVHQSENITLRQGRHAVLVTNNKNSINKGNFSSTFDKLKAPMNVLQSNTAPSDNISKSDSDIMSVQDEIDSCFGFTEDTIPPAGCTPGKVTTRGTVNVLKNVIIHGIENVESPIDFNVRRPNANSTMVHIRTQNRSLSPWRSEWVNARTNPHFLSVKGNALPRLDQEPVLEHTLVEGFEKRCSKTPRKEKGLAAKKAPIQQSILGFVESNIEVINEALEGSLYDYDAFNSPVKKNVMAKENQRVEGVKRNVMGNKANIVSSTPNPRRVLGDISNSSEEQIFTNSSPEENSYFGFNETSLTKKTPEKRRHKRQNVENIETENIARPTRFDLSILRSYVAKGKRKKPDDKGKQEETVAEEEEIQVPDKSISLMEGSNEENDDEEIRLFEEPEEMLDSMSPAPIAGKKHRRNRLDSDDFDAGEKRKRPKKTKLEIEQEEWIEEFNHMCEEVDQHQLELV